MKKIITAAAALSLLLAGGLWLTAGSAQPGDVRASAPTAATGMVHAALDELVEIAPRAPGSERSLAGLALLASAPSYPEVLQDPPPTTGTLLVQVISHDTGLPVQAVGLSLTAMTTSSWYDSQSGQTDAQGETWFHDLPPTKVKVTAWRTGPEGESVASGRIEMTAGETSKLTLRLSGGDAIFGRVVDELDHGVAHAEIWLSRGNGGPTTSLLAGYSDAQGRFELPHTTKVQAVGARAPGMEPSIQKMPHILKPKDPELGTRLVLKGLGGQLRGRVVGESGEPIAGALVRIERLGPPRAGQPIAIDGGFAYAPAALMLRADAQGAFSTHTMGSGSFLITARGRETDLTTAEVVVASGGQGEVELVVGGAGSLSGVVTDHLGIPIAGADVAVAGSDLEFGYAETATDAAGAFTLSALPTGPLEVTVVAEQGRQGIEETVQIRADRETTWNPSFPAPLTIVGSAFSSNGSALEGFHVRGSASDETGPLAKFQVDVQADGSFVAPNCLDAAYDLALHLPGQWVGDPHLQLEAVRAGSVDTEFVLSESSLPTSSLVGVVVNDAGQPIPFRLIVQRRDPFAVISRKFSDPDGAFELPYLAPGQYELSFEAKGYVSRALELGAPLGENEVREIPEVRLAKQP